MSDEGGRASWLEPLPEEYVTDDDMTGRRMLFAAITVVVLVIFGGMVWYSYLEGADSGPVPVVHADKSVVKEKPVTPGGLQVPDQDKGVFNRVASGQVDNSEKLESSAELPIERPVDLKLTEEKAEIAEKAPPVAEEKKEEVVVPPKPKVVVKEEKVIAPEKVDKIGNFLVQLGAFGKNSTAVELWRKIQKKNYAILKGFDSDIMMIDLGKRGIFYRLRAGPIIDRASAGKVCVALKANKQACIVVVK
ncbi:MAG: SPOR domain-containing protein [Emcibacter sp.]|nr:SPOR domain-containing protein [Emcibacter sp.]